MSKEMENKLVPKLRFPEFEGGVWVLDKVDNLINVVTPPKKLQSSQYLEEGIFPIIDQSKSEICGWTNDVESVISNELPLIIFGDHTCILKFVNQSFSQGADGVKILKPNNKIYINFLYQALNNNPVKQEEYKRHFSILKEKLIAFPDVNSGEQQKIADCLSSLDDLITTETEKLDALKEHKKGLMQQLFPAEGEKVPKLRFPEFKDSGEWVCCSVGDFVDNNVLYAPKDGNHGNIHPKSSDYIKKGIPFIMASDVKKGTVDLYNCSHISKNQADKLQKGFSLEGDVLLSHKGTVGQVALLEKNEFPYVMLTPQVTYYRVKDKAKVLNRYLAVLFLSDNFQKQLHVVSGGGTRAYIGITEQLRLKLLVPSTLNEQKRIANIISTLDNQIMLQENKIEDLKLHKKGLMQQLFPSIH